MIFTSKTVIINRAVPGSGKTTISNRVMSHLKQTGVPVSIHSTDEFFMDGNGHYVFNLDKLYTNHQSNLASFIQSLQAGCSVVICDNINLSPWETEPYTTAARRFGYKIIFLNFVPRELEKHVQSQQVTEEKPDAHGVPEEVLIRFIKEFEDFNSLLDPYAPIEPAVHKQYAWDPTINKRVDTGKPSRHFDVDKTITIMPDEYHSLKEEIGQIVYESIQRLWRQEQ